MRPAIETVKAALPGTDPALIGGVLANLFDLWETGQTLDKKLRKLGKLRLPRDRQSLRNVLQWVEAIQLDMASYWISEIRKDLPEILSALDKLERAPVHYPARKAKRSPRR